MMPVFAVPLREEALIFCLVEVFSDVVMSPDLISPFSSPGQQ